MNRLHPTTNRCRPSTVGCSCPWVCRSPCVNGSWNVDPCRRVACSPRIPWRHNVLSSLPHHDKTLRLFYACLQEAPSGEHCISYLLFCIAWKRQPLFDVYLTCYLNREVNPLRNSWPDLDLVVLVSPVSSKPKSKLK